MLLVREIFIAKPGHAGELAKMMKAEMNFPDASGRMPEVFLDQVTDYNTIVVHYYVKSLADFETIMNQEKAKQQSAKPKKESKGPKYTELYLTGKREILRVVE
jgi:hypothetical protein